MWRRRRRKESEKRERERERKEREREREREKERERGWYMRVWLIVSEIDWLTERHALKEEHFIFYHFLFNYSILTPDCVYFSIPQHSARTDYLHVHYNYFAISLPYPRLPVGSQVSRHQGQWAGYCVKRKNTYTHTHARIYIYIYIYIFICVCTWLCVYLCAFKHL